MKHNIYALIITLSISTFFTACTLSDVEDNGIVGSCDEIIDKEYYEVCYDYDLKGALFVSYSLDGDRVDSNNLEDRPRFYSEPTLEDEYSSSYNDYIGSGYDRGHLASDASFDWSYNSLDSVYSMVNIIPQNPDVNRYTWIDTEFLERTKAVEYGSVEVIIGVVYSDNLEQIGENFISVPTAFYKSISNAEFDYHECFYYENIPEEDDDIDEHRVECSSLSLRYDRF